MSGQDGLGGPGGAQGSPKYELQRSPEKAPENIIPRAFDMTLSGAVSGALLEHPRRPGEPREGPRGPCRRGSKRAVKKASNSIMPGTLLYDTVGRSFAGPLEPPRRPWRAPGAAKGTPKRVSEWSLRRPQYNTGSLWYQCCWGLFRRPTSSPQDGPGDPREGPREPRGEGPRGAPMSICSHPVWRSWKR